MKKLTNQLILLLAIVLVSGCAGIKMLGPDSQSGIYSEKFLQTIGKIKEKYNQGRKGAALTDLKLIDNLSLLPAERALKNNLIGVIYFSQKKYEEAIVEFNNGLQSSTLDPSLASQMYLNIASAHYKLGRYSKSLANLSLGDSKKLSKEERKNYFQLKYRLSVELERGEEKIKSLIDYFRDEEKLDSIKNQVLFDKLNDHYFSFDSQRRLRIIQEFDSKVYLVVGYLNFLEGEKAYYEGRREEAKDLLEWTKGSFSNWGEVVELVDDFFNRAEDRTQIDPRAIGVVLPLSGKNKQYGQRALMGIDLAFRKINDNVGDGDSLSGNNLKLVIRDSKGLDSVGSHYIKDLIENKHVAMIIGGLFPHEAKGEYLEAKKYGVPFVSLSQIFLSKEEKNSLLLEVPGSVESQIDRLFSTDFLEKLGKKAAIMYPNSERGRAYINEFWRKSKLNDVLVTDALSYAEKTTDYREQVKNILGLKFERQRSEEYELLKEVHSLESKKSIRRLQTLKPQIDFDWIFIPSYPYEALQIIPSFNYFDAFNLNIIGSPSWRSQKLRRESGKLGRIMFIGDEGELDGFSENFYSVYKRKPSFIEARSYDSMQLVKQVLSHGEIETREHILMSLSSIDELKGMTGSWNKKEGIWLKKLAVFNLKNGRFSQDPLVSADEKEIELKKENP